MLMTGARAWWPRGAASYQCPVSAAFFNVANLCNQLQSLPADVDKLVVLQDDILSVFLARPGRTKQL